MQMIPHLRLHLKTTESNTFLVGTTFVASLTSIEENPVTRRSQRSSPHFSLEFDLHIDLHSFPYLDEDVPETSNHRMGDDVREWSMSDVVFLTGAWHHRRVVCRGHALFELEEQVTRRRYRNCRLQLPYRLRAGCYGCPIRPDGVE